MLQVLHCMSFPRDPGKKVWQNFGMLGLHRLCLFGGLRIELYEPVKTFYVGKYLYCFLKFVEIFIPIFLQTKNPIG
ncbi:unnamed protein product [Amaranthus hypochondriacus]